MEEKKVMVCLCENCGNEAEMTVKCEEAVAPEKPCASGQAAQAHHRLHAMRQRS